MKRRRLRSGSVVRSTPTLWAPTARWLGARVASFHFFTTEQFFVYPSSDELTSSSHVAYPPWSPFPVPAVRLSPGITIRAKPFTTRSTSFHDNSREVLPAASTNRIWTINPFACDGFDDIIDMTKPVHRGEIGKSSFEREDTCKRKSADTSSSEQENGSLSEGKNRNRNRSTSSSRSRNDSPSRSKRKRWKARKIESSSRGSKSTGKDGYLPSIRTETRAKNRNMDEIWNRGQSKIRGKSTTSDGLNEGIEWEVGGSPPIETKSTSLRRNSSCSWTKSMSQVCDFLS